MKKQILLSALEQRKHEVLGYQINIDNYHRAIEYMRINYDPDLESFADQLNQLLKTEILEQKKAKVIMTVIEQQLAELS
jgi:hypothetical protein